MLFSLIRAGNIDGFKIVPNKIASNKLIPSIDTAYALLSYAFFYEICGIKKRSVIRGVKETMGKNTFLQRKYAQLTSHGKPNKTKLKKKKIEKKKYGLSA